MIKEEKYRLLLERNLSEQLTAHERGEGGGGGL